MTAWVASEIVSAPILKQRVAVITFFIRVSEVSAGLKFVSLRAETKAENRLARSSTTSTR